MENSAILKHIDHTLLKPTAAWEDIQKLCNEAVQYKTASVCVPPSYVARIKESFGDQLIICTVIGFPLGYHTTASKIYETEKALEDGADEIDMVINLGDVKEGAYKQITEEIRELKKTVGSRILKVIIETCYLTQNEKIRICQCVTEGGADYIKTSTGFGPSGAVLEDIHLFKAYLGPYVKIKAAGGLKTREDLVAFINAGCERIGTSSAVSILAGEEAQSY